MDFKQFFTTHTWWGKVLGGFFGYLIAGSAGALLGILIGNLFDRGIVTHFSRPHWSSHEEYDSTIQAVFLESAFNIMGYIAKTDGRVSENEIHMANQIMQEMGLNKQQQFAAQNSFVTGKSIQFNLQSSIEKLYAACSNNPGLLKNFIDIQYRFAQVDGLNAHKINILNKLLQSLGFAPLYRQSRFYDDFEKQYSSYTSSKQNKHAYASQSSLAQAYTILEIAESANKEEVKKAYRRLISKNHPDKLIAQGQSEEKIKVANDKTQRITKAYDLICEVKGWHH